MARKGAAMDPFHDLAEMARDYGLIRYFLLTVGIAIALMTVLFLWGRVPDPAEPQPDSQPPAATAGPTSSY